jgi:adenine-specific DNA-methyltransferase
VADNSTHATRLQLVWPNKDKFLLVPKDQNGKPVWVDPSHPAAHEVRLTDFVDAVGEVNEADPYADNILFSGDGMDVLRILSEVPEYRHHYRGKVKLIYIDPPFNTGQAFPHYDDWLEHSTWLSFMRDRLTMMRDLLSQEGSIWVHLDDAEMHRMRCLLDEVFGAGKFVATVVWQKIHARDNRASLSTSQDYILVYAMNPASWRNSRNLLRRSDAQASTYANPDNDPRGLWASDNFTAQVGGGNDRKSQIYTLTTPAGLSFDPPSGSCWRYTKDRYLEMLADNRVTFGADGKGRPRLKRFLSEVPDGVVPMTWWPHLEVGHNQEGKKEIKALFPKLDPFSTPKPERLLQRIIHIGSNPGDIVLDIFAGSGTTAAVAQKMGRRWLTSEVSDATAATFTMPRLSAVIDGSDLGGVSKEVDWRGGGGFRTVGISPSMYETTPFGVMLNEFATNGRFARAVAGQLGFTFDQNGSPFCGRRGRMRLAVFDGVVGCEEARELVAMLEESERVTIVAKAILPGTSELLGGLSKGSRIRKAPRDLLVPGGSMRRTLTLQKEVRQ